MYITEDQHEQHEQQEQQEQHQQEPQKPQEPQPNPNPPPPTPSHTPKTSFTSRYAITFGQASILHIGSRSIGQISQHGYSCAQLKQILHKARQQYGIEGKLIDLTEWLPVKLRDGNQAAVLHLPGCVDALVGEEGFCGGLYLQQEGVEYDMKYYDARRKKTLNKRARYNIVFGQQQVKKSPDYQQFTIKPFHQLPHLKKLRQTLPNLLGPRSTNLPAQGNRYHTPSSGIGFHGDSQRKVVICLSLGRTSTLRYWWRVPGSSENRYGPIDVGVRHGDVYVMSEKASGWDWRRRGVVRVVHAAGSERYIGRG